MLTTKNARAYGVLAALYANHVDDEMTRLYVRSFRNGREEGFAAEYHDLTQSTTPHVAWAQHKISDAIVVYAGASTQFDFCTGLPDDALFDTAQFFGPNDFAAAAAAIWNQLTGTPVLEHEDA